MKSYTLERVQLPTIVTLDDNLINRNISPELFTTLETHKSYIDNYRGEWISAKKISNAYEYVYTSSNLRKNISSFIPVSRSFFKLREIIYDLSIPISGKIACVAEAPGGFIQSLLLHDKYTNTINEIYGITLLSDNKEIPYWNTTLIKNDKVTICNGYDGTGNLYSLNNVLQFISTCKRHTCQVITADGGFDYTTDFEQELSSYRLFYSEIMIALCLQEVGGTFICKMFELFHYSTLQLVYILYRSYESITFIKPCTSRVSNSEKYIVCKGFKGYDKDITNIMCSYFDHDMLPVVLPEEFIKMIIHYHSSFVNNQITHITATLKLISDRVKYDKPTRVQLRKAREWCKKYKIKENKGCMYLY